MFPVEPTVEITVRSGFSDVSCVGPADEAPGDVFAGLPSFGVTLWGDGIGKSAINTDCHALGMGECLDSSVPFLSTLAGARGLAD